MAGSRRRSGGETRRRLGFESLEERRVLSVSVELASKAAWSPASANGDSGGASQLFSGDGRYLLFESEATNLVAGVTYAGGDDRNVYRLDRSSGAIELVSFASSRNVAAASYCEAVGVSHDGSLILFRSDKPVLNAPDDDAHYEWTYYLRDMTTGLTKAVNLDSAGTDAFLIYAGPECLSDDGSKFAFVSPAEDLDSRDTNSQWDAFVFDFDSGATELVSVNPQGTASANEGAYSCQISADGTTVLFGSESTDLDPLDAVPGSRGDVYARNLLTNTTRLVSVNAAGTAGTNGDSGSIAVSAEGGLVLFGSVANGLHASDQNNSNDIFVRDLASGTTTWVSREFDNVGNARFAADSRLIVFRSGDQLYVYDLLNQTSTQLPGVPADRFNELSISDDGNVIAFATERPLSPLDEQLFSYDVYVVDRISGTLQLASTRFGDEPNEYNALSWPASYGAAVSPDGSIVAFTSASDALVTGDANFRSDVFAYDIDSGQNQLLSRHAEELEWESGNSESKLEGQSVSADGRYVAFSSYATNLVEGLESTGRRQVYRYDRLTDKLEVASIDLWNGDGDHTSYKAAISGDGNVVAFINVPISSWGVPGEASLYLKDFATGTTRRIAMSVVDEPPSISADGSRVAFRRGSEVYVYDWNTDETEEVSVTIDGSGVATGIVTRPAISANGRVVAFASTAYNLHPLDTYFEQQWPGGPRFGSFDVYARDIDAGVTHLVSVNHAGTAAGDKGSMAPSISADGNLVAFESGSSDLLVADEDSVDGVDGSNIFVRDLAAGTTRLVSPHFLGQGMSSGGNEAPIISADGTVVVFGSEATDLHPLDGSDNPDVYAFDLTTGELHWASRDTSPAGGTGEDESNYNYSVSGNGRVVAFTAEIDRYNSLAYNLETRATRLVSVNAVQPNAEDEYRQNPTVNYDGDVIAFQSQHNIYLASIHWDAPPLPGDFNLDGSVDATDYSVWRDSLGATELVPYSGADGDGDGMVDQDDYLVWKANFGRVDGAGGTGQGAGSQSNSDILVPAVGNAAMDKSSREVAKEQFADERRSDGTRGVRWRSGLELLNSVEHGGRARSKPPADPEAGCPAGAGGRTFDSAHQRDLALMTWRSRAQRRGRVLNEVVVDELVNDICSADAEETDDVFEALGSGRLSLLTR